MRFGWGWGTFVGMVDKESVAVSGVSRLGAVKPGLVRVAKVLYFVVLGVVVFVTARWVWESPEEFGKLLVGTRWWGLVVVVVGLYGLVVVSSLMWLTNLRMLSADGSGGSGWGGVLESATVPLPVRWLPAGPLIYSGTAAGLLRSAGWRLSVSSVAVGLEAAVLLVCAVVVASSAAFVAGVVLPVDAGWLLVCAVVAVVGLSPPVVRVLLGVVGSRVGFVLDYSWSGFVRVLGLGVLYWVVLSSLFVFYLWCFPGVVFFGDMGVFGVAAGFVFAWLSGQLSVVFPQGVGVFEGVMLFLAQPGDGLVSAAGLLAGWRLLLLVRDVVSSVLCRLVVAFWSVRAGR